MEDKDNSRVLALLIAGMLIWFALLSVPENSSAGTAFYVG